MERLQVEELFREVEHSVECDNIRLFLFALRIEAILDAPQAAISFSAASRHSNIDCHARLSRLDSQRLISKRLAV